MNLHKKFRMKLKLRIKTGVFKVLRRKYKIRQHVIVMELRRAEIMVRLTFDAMILHGLKAKKLRKT